MPDPVVTLLSSEIRKALELPERRDKLLGLDMQRIAASPEQTAAQLQADRKRWAELIAVRNIQAD